jgi:hypothetical protein
VTPGYWRNPAATAAAFKDGWFLTGDLAVIDAHGFVNIVDRKKDVIKTGGETVFSTEVEQVVYAHPAVQEAAVVGVPHPRWGEAVVAVVVPRAGSRADESALLDHCRAHLGKHQVAQARRLPDGAPAHRLGQDRQTAAARRARGPRGRPDLDLEDRFDDPRSRPSVPRPPLRRRDPRDRAAARRGRRVVPPLAGRRSAAAADRPRPRRAPTRRRRPPRPRAPSRSRRSGPPSRSRRRRPTRSSGPRRRATRASSRACAAASSRRTGRRSPA